MEHILPNKRHKTQPCVLLGGDRLWSPPELLSGRAAADLATHSSLSALTSVVLQVALS